MFEKLKEIIRGWFVDPKVGQFIKTAEVWHSDTGDRLNKISRRIDTSDSRINIISDGIDKNAMFFSEKMRDIVDLRMRIEYLERRLKGDLFHLTANDVAVAKKMGMSIEEYAKNKLAIMCEPPAPIKRGRPKGSKNNPKPVVEKPVRRPRAKK